MKTGPSARHRGTRIRARARTCMAVAGLTVVGFVASGLGAAAGIAFAAAESTSDPIQITYRITSGNALGLTVVNNGVFGNNFSSRAPSFEYPLGSNVDHMPRGGIWVGGITAEGDTLVTTATMDGNVSGLLPTLELLPVAGTTITERSMLPESRYYDRRARSEQDFLYSCADTSAEINPPGVFEPHRPLGLRINTETLLYSFDPLEAAVIVNYKIINIGIDPLRDVVVGFYSELATGYKIPGVPVEQWTVGWWKNVAMEYIPDTTRLVMEHHYAYPDGPASSWAGIKLLGSKPTPIDSCRVSFNWWRWDPTNPWGDAARYALISNGELDAPTDSREEDPVEILSVGGRTGTPSAFDFLESGDTLTVSFAFVGGHDDPHASGRDARADLLYHAAGAQYAYGLDFFLPPPSPDPPEPFSLASPADEESLDTTEPTLFWQTARETDPGDTVSYTIYWSRDAAFDPPDSVTAGLDTTYTFSPSTLLGGSTYHWKVRAWDNRGLTRWSTPSGGWVFHTPPITPIGLALQAQTVDSGILLTWNVPADMHTLGFTVYRRIAGSEVWLCLSPLLSGADATCTYVDEAAEPGVPYEYEVEVLGPSGPAGRWGPVSAELPELKLWLGLSPNPGRQTLTVAFGLPQSGRAVLRLIDTGGREVAREVLPGLRAGNHSRAWTPGGGQIPRLRSGAYWVRLETSAGSRTARWTWIE